MRLLSGGPRSYWILALDTDLDNGRDADRGVRDMVARWLQVVPDNLETMKMVVTKEINS